MISYGEITELTDYAVFILNKSKQNQSEFILLISRGGENMTDYFRLDIIHLDLSLLSWNDLPKSKD